MITAIKNNLFHIAAFSLLFASIVFFAYTGNYFILIAPLFFLYVVLLGVNWQGAYWIFLFSIPASVQINFSNDTMAVDVDFPAVICAGVGQESRYPAQMVVAG
jgi:hypothetical protein